MKVLNHFDASLVKPSSIARKGVYENGVIIIGFNLTSKGKDSRKLKKRYWLFHGATLNDGIKINISTDLANQLIRGKESHFISVVQSLFQPFGVEGCDL